MIKHITSPTPRHNSRTGGAVIIVVLALMTTLLVLGLFFYYFTVDEALNAQNVADVEDINIDDDEIFNIAQQQLIVSTPDENRYSALYGGQWSLLAQIFGPLNGNGSPRQLTPYSGQGMQIEFIGTATDVNMDGHTDAQSDNEWYVTFSEDLNGNGMLDPGEDLNNNGTIDTAWNGNSFRLNGGAAASTGGVNPALVGVPVYLRYPVNDGTSYPDITSPMLAVDYLDMTDPTNPVRILRPSFFPIQLFPDYRASGDLDQIRAAQSFRPHPSHIALPEVGPLTDIRRFLSTASVAASGDRSRIINPFPGMWNPGTPQFLSAGEWTNSMATFGYQYDVDVTGDGQTDAIRLDLGHPHFDLPDGRQVVPIFAVKIMEQDGLFNLAAHGNENRRISYLDSSLNPLPAQASLDARSLLNDTAKTPTPDPAPDATPVPIHGSNHGLSVTEINPEWGFFASPHRGAFVPGGTPNPALTNSLMPNYNTVLQPILGTDIGSFFASGTSGKRKHLTTANMELYFLLRGRSGVAGRWGSDFVAGKDYVSVSEFEDANFNGILDMGEDLNGNGRLDGDEDFDYFLGGREHLDRYLGNVVQPPFVHPLDYRGVAFFPDSDDVARSSYVRAVTTFNNLPGVWPDYGSYYGQFWENEGGGTETLHGVDTVREAGGGALQSDGILGLVNEPDKMIHENSFRHTSIYRNDSAFGPEETAALRLTDRDASSLGQQSIVKNLASFNLRDNTQAETIRQQFTTTSFDRNEFSFNFWPTRSWEFNDTFDNGGALPPAQRFPPSFGATGPTGITSRHELMPAYDPAGTPSAAAVDINGSDPFRPVVRRLLTIDRARQNGGVGGGRVLPQNRLDINRLLVNFDPDGNPIYRELMPHPVFDPSDTDTNNYLDNAGTPRPTYHANIVTGYRNVDEDNPAFTPFTLSDLDPDIPTIGGFASVSLNACSTDKFAQEVWARHDRQRLARDIFVMLWTLGGVDPATGDNRNYAVNGHNLGDTTDNDGDGMYDVRQRIREMAQFAVNYVDALDRDNVITRFEFDYDLTDGWDIPSNADPSTDNDPNNDTYGWVYGVEEVSLTLSEALVIRAKTQGTDLQRTLHNDIDGMHEEHRFLYLELRNNSPFEQNLYTDTWRIVRTNINDHAVLASVSFQGDAADSKSVVAGGNFVIATCDDDVTNANGDQIPADFYADFETGIGGGDDDLEAFAPHHRSTHTVANNTSIPPLALCDLDLHTTEVAHTNYYAWGTTARLVESTADSSGSSGSPLIFDIVLQRRRNLNGAGFGENEWIEVDRIQINESVVFDPAGDQRSDIREELLEPGAPGNSDTGLPGMRSYERAEPFAAGTFVNNGHNPTAAAPNDLPHSLEGMLAPSTATERARKNHSLGVANFSTWQPHFDRDFSSVMELLSVPLFGYRSHTNGEDFVDTLHGGPTRNLAEGNSGGLIVSGHRTAMRRFAYPSAATAGGLGNVANNRWFRILGLLDVPLEDGKAIDNMVTIQRRKAGKVNLNAVVHETIYAGLMDDPAFNELNPNAWLNGGNRLTQDPITGINRFDDFRIARDGVDHLTGRYLPGLPGSLPFKPLGAVNSVNPNLSVEESLLRESPNLVGTTAQYRLLTASNAGGTPTILDTDIHTSNRILSKIANLTTTRSHVYAMWISYQMHDCHVVTNSVGSGVALQIGAVAEDFPMKRMFCLVDMSRLEEAYDPVTNTFDYRKFIIYEQPLP